MGVGNMKTSSSCSNCKYHKLIFALGRQKVTTHTLWVEFIKTKIYERVCLNSNKKNICLDPEGVMTCKYFKKKFGIINF